MKSDEVEDLTQGKTVYGCPDCGGKARWMGFPATVADWDMHLQTKASAGENEGRRIGAPDRDPNV